MTSMGPTVLLSGLVVLVVSSSAPAQIADPPTRMVNVDGLATRVAVAELERRTSGQPVIVLEAGAGETGIETWTPVFGELARVAPVLAYDRRGIGQSEPDTEKPTLRRGAQSLHALLGRLNIPPPYVLVGHSWGGLPIRAYFDQYSDAGAGLVFLDAVDPGRTRDERAQAVGPAERETVLAPPTLPPIPPDTPPGVRAEYELIGSEMVDDYPEARSLRSPTGVPVVVVLAAPPARVKNLGDAISLGPNDLAGIALRSPNGLFLAAGHVGHAVHRDDPELVVRLVERILKHATTPAAQ